MTRRPPAALSHLAQETRDAKGTTPHQRLNDPLADCSGPARVVRTVVSQPLFPSSFVDVEISVWIIRMLPRNFHIDFNAETSRSAQLIALLRVKTPSQATAISALSGGNQQKVIIARWLNADARVLLMDEPTRGIDVAARSEIYGHMYRLAETGKTILFASSDIPEVMGVADRIVVMREGRIAAIMERSAATPDRLLRLALPDGRASA